LPRVTGADEPKAAITSRTEYEVMASKEVEGRGNLRCSERRDVGPDEHHRTGPAGFERAAHSDPKIPLPLPHSLDPAAPKTGAAAGLVWCHCDPQPPAPVFREPAEQQGDHRPLKAKSCDIADLLREPTLAASELWGADEQNEGAVRHP
jgi:hypothetical protein